MASESARADVTERRHEWLCERQPLMRREPHRLVFIDQASINIKMTRLRGRVMQGKRLAAATDVRNCGPSGA